MKSNRHVLNCMASKSGCDEDETWTIALERSRKSICNGLYNIVEILVALQSVGVMTQTTRSQIESLPTKFQQNDELVTWLLTRPEATFQAFLKALQNTGNSHIEHVIIRKLSKVAKRQSSSKNKELAKKVDSSPALSPVVPDTNKAPMEKSTNSTMNGAGKLFPWFTYKEKNTTRNKKDKRNMKDCSAQTCSFDEPSRGDLVLLQTSEKERDLGVMEKAQRRNELVLLHTSARKRNLSAKKKAYSDFPKGLILCSCIQHSDHHILIYDIENDIWDKSLHIPGTSHHESHLGLINFDGLLCSVGKTDVAEIGYEQLQVYSVVDGKWISCPAIPMMNVVSYAYMKPNIFAIGKSSKDATFTLLRMGMDFVWHEILDLDDKLFKCDCYIEALNDKLYLFAARSNVIVEYEPVTKSMRQFNCPQHLGKFLQGFNTVALHGCIVIVGGHKSGVCERYCPENDTWDQLTTLPVSVSYAAVATDGERIFVMGGRDRNGIIGRFIDNVQIYDYIKNEWSNGESVPYIPLSYDCSVAARFVPPEVLHP